VVPWPSVPANDNHVKGQGGGQQTEEEREKRPGKERAGTYGKQRGEKKDEKKR